MTEIFSTNIARKLLNFLYFLRGGKYRMLTMGLLLFATSCTAQQKVRNEILEGDWYIELQHNDIGMVRTMMHFDTDRETFEAFTRKKADKDILGSLTSILGRTFTKDFKDGCLLRIENGIMATEQDTVKWAGILTSAIGKYNIEGFVFNNELYATIKNNSQGYKGKLKGFRKQLKLPMEDYPALFEKSISLTESKIYNKDFLETKDWKAFVKNMRMISPKMQDDLEMVFAFFYYGRKLPLSHYALMKIPEPEIEETPQKYKRRVFLEEKSPSTAYLKITSFDGSATEMEENFSIIKQKNYQNLIVDLRNNPGGSVEAGMAFATNIVDSTFYGGVFLTQKYFNRLDSLPAISDYNKFPVFTEANSQLIIEGIHNVEGLCLKVIPQETIYRGKIYILTNNKTASTCEPIVYGLKQHKYATIVGEKTAGAMLNAEVFDLDKGFKMIIPTADYYSSDGFRIDQNGINPDIEVKGDALEYVMKNLINK